MAEIQPFRGLRYNPGKIKFNEIIAEPYDRITPQMQEDYYRRSPYNVVRIILGRDDDLEHPEKNKYKRAKIYLDEWEKAGILIREDKKALYFYEQEFRVRNESKRRMGLIARVKLEDFSSKRVLPHEKTFPKQKEDRLNLLRTTKTNTEQIFLLLEDDKKTVARAITEAMKKAELAGEVMDEDKFLHKLWVVKNKKAIQKIQEALKDKILIIADGHHRYETSLNYQAEMRREKQEIRDDEAFNYIMMTLFDLNDPGLVILPTYRLVKGLEKLKEESLKKLFSAHFEITEMNWSDLRDKSTLEKVQKAIDEGSHTFAAYMTGIKKFFIFNLKAEDILDREISGERSKAWKRLDVAILHSLLIDKLQALTDMPFDFENNVNYIRNLDEGLRKVRDGEYQLLFLLKPTSLPQIGEVVEKGELMPHKSTDFFPKLKSGLIMNPLED